MMRNLAFPDAEKETNICLVPFDFPPPSRVRLFIQPLFAKAPTGAMLPLAVAVPCCEANCIWDIRTWKYQGRKSRCAAQTKKENTKKAEKRVTFLESRRAMQKNHHQTNLQRKSAE